MDDSNVKDVVVIGLGGGGTEIAQDLRERFSEAADFLTLDFDSEPFDDFFMGQLFDVSRQENFWFEISGSQENFQSWFDKNRYSPLRELAIRGNNRPIMRAGLLMYKERMWKYLERRIDAHKHVILVTQTCGSTGSAWIADISHLVLSKCPSAKIDLVLIGEMPYTPPPVRWIANSFWTLREIFGDKALAKHTHVLGSKKLAGEIIANMIARSLIDFGVEKSWQTEDFVVDLGRTIFSLSQEHNFLFFRPQDARIRTISEVMTYQERAALAGLIVSIAELRIKDSKDFQNETYIKFQSRKSDLTQTLYAPSLEGVESYSLRLALAHRIIGPEGHCAAYDQLVEEGLDALVGANFSLKSDDRSRMVEMDHQVKDLLDNTPRQRDHLTALIHDVFPVVQSVISKILENDGTPNKSNVSANT